MMTRADARKIGCSTYVRAAATPTMRMRQPAMTSHSLRMTRKYCRSGISSGLIELTVKILQSEVALGNNDHVVRRQRKVPILPPALDHIVQVDDDAFLSAILLVADNARAVRGRLVGEAAGQSDTLEDR